MAQTSEFQPLDTSAVNDTKQGKKFTNSIKKAN